MSEAITCPECDEEMELVSKQNEKYYVCHNCEHGYPKCEVYSRVVGYLRPKDNWNPGKQEEFDDRADFSTEVTTDG